MNKEKYEKYFELVIIAVLVSIYALFFLKRVIFPDDSFDTLNYHFFLGKSGFENFPFAFKKVEFFPLGLHSFNPLIDMIGYGGYLIFGYRLGTVFSFLSLAGTSFITLHILKKVVGNKLSILGLFMIIPAFIVNEGIFQVGTYYTDNIYAFILALYVFLLFKFINIINIRIRYLFMLIMGLVMGLIITKLTNVIYVVPLLFITAYFIYDQYRNEVLSNIKEIVALFLIYFMVIIGVNFFMFLGFHQTGNPIFPFFNGIFKSIYFPQVSWHFNFGPISFFEKIFYPYYAIKNPVIMGEVKDLFPDIKLIIEFLFILVSYAILFLKKTKLTKYEGSLLFIFISSFLFWQIQFGYSRYAIFLELIGGVLSIVLIQRIFLKEKCYIFLKFIAALYLVYLVFQTGKILNFNFMHDISWRPTVSFDEWSNIFFSSNIFSKYTSISNDIVNDLKDVDVVIQCINPSSAYFSTIRELKNVTMVNFDMISNIDLTSNNNYKTKRDLMAIGDKLSPRILNFAIVFNKNQAFLGNEKNMCLDVLYKNGINIDNEFEINNFVGNKSEKLVLMTGDYQVK